MKAANSFEAALKYANYLNRLAVSQKAPPFYCYYVEFYNEEHRGPVIWRAFGRETWDKPNIIDLPEHHPIDCSQVRKL